jgi:ribosomal protein L34
MTIDDDDAKLLTSTDSPGTDAPTEIRRGWASIGAIIVDASLQRRQNYNETVKPRVEALIASWPDADTTSGFRKRLATGTLSQIIMWPSPGRLGQMEDLTRVLEDQGIETVEELRARLSDPEGRHVLREALAAVRHMGPKSLDYFDTLSGLSTVD